MKAATNTTATDALAPRFQFVGGKGGVGKTTCAAALSVAAAERGARVLVASVDPAPSLADAFDVPLTHSPRDVPVRKGQLAAVEINPQRSFRRWLDERRPVLETIAVQGTWLDQDDVARLLQLSLPGVDEIAALFEIARLARSSRYDLVIVDTAPTGHTLRMLAMPETLGGVAAVFDRMREKRRVMEVALRGGWTAGVEDALIAEMIQTSGELAALLRDDERTRVLWVTLAEPMVVEETRDALAALRETGIGVDTVIANRLTPPPATPCGHCDARRSIERRALRGLPGSHEVTSVRERDVEPRGIPAMRAIAADLSRPAPAGSAPARGPAWMATLTGPAVRPEELAPGELRLLMFGGKGGVGKTTCAAATALAVARRRPDRRVLLVSTDPAHSLSDVLGRAVSNEPRPVARGPSNLDVREIDPAAVLARIRERYLTAIDRMFDRVSGSSFDAAHDRAVMRSLIELAPPGLDELVAVLEVTDAISEDPSSWDLVIMDTAPTGHALRLLEMPHVVQEWARALMSVLLKYQGVARFGELGETLLRVSKGVGRLRDLLASPEHCSFVAVTRGAALPRLETGRLIKRLIKLRVHVPAVIVNSVGRGECRRCARQRTGERREIARIQRSLASGARRRMILAPTHVPPPAGAAALRRWGGAWRGAPGYHQSR